MLVLPGLFIWLVALVLVLVRPSINLLLFKKKKKKEAEIAVHSVTNGSLSTNEDQLSLKDTLAAVRNAAQAAASIQSAFRALFQKAAAKRRCRC